MARPYQQPTTPDVPSTSTNTRRRPPPHFYLNSTGVSPALVPRDQHQSATQSSSTQMSLPSLPSTPGHSRRTSRASLAALRSALQTYQIPSPDEYTRFGFDTTSTQSGRDLGQDSFRLDQGSPQWNDMKKDQRMDALVEIHRVLYRGKEDHMGETVPWREQGPEVRRVVERWFETDCSYDHPLVRLSSRQAVLTHFVLLHLMSTAYLPTLTPSNIIFHVRNVTSRVRARLLGNEEREGERDVRDVEQGQVDLKGKKKMVEDEWYGLSPEPEDKNGDEESAVAKDGRWFRVWDVSADCREIGNMESYDGYQLAMIEHVVSLTLFPSLSRRRIDPESLLRSSASSDSIHSLDLVPPKSFSGRVVNAIADEFDYLLRWDLPVSTIVHFNESGKATHVRDTIDLMDLVETFVPFAKRLGWLTRRFTGLVSSTVGSAALALLPVPSVNVAKGIKSSKGAKGAEPVGLGFDIPTDQPRPAGLPGRRRRDDNTLGLEGMPVAPDYQPAYD